jgi:hypothetical protein
VHVEPADLVILSATLPYGFDPGPGRTERTKWGFDLRALARPGGAILVIEPAAKQYELDRVAAALELADCRLERVPLMATRRRLPEMTQLATQVARDAIGAARGILAEPVQTAAERPDIAFIAYPDHARQGPSRRWRHHVAAAAPRTRSDTRRRRPRLPLTAVIAVAVPAATALAWGLVWWLA